MRYTDIGGIKCSRLVLGCMRIADKPTDHVRRLIELALDMGINMFDHADIYGGGTCERIYGDIIKSSPALRERMVLQTKCGIRGGWYDLGYEHIVKSAEDSLARLGTDRLDILLLHRPDTLMRPEEIARAFDALEKSGKVRVFGVSNFSAGQVDYLQSFVNQKLYVDQLQMSAAYCPVIDSGINVNTPTSAACDRDGGVLEYCRKHRVTIQTYGTVQCLFADDSGCVRSGAFMSGDFKKKYFSLNFMLEGLARKYSVTPEAVAAAWILVHPADMQAVIGTTDEKHLEAFRAACEVPLTNYEWYKIYESAGHSIP